MCSSKNNWKNNAIQFPRVIAEILATQPTLDFFALAHEMDLEMEDLNELLDRAQNEWDRIKALMAIEEAVNEEPDYLAGFRRTVDMLSTEWLEKDGSVTCEFSTGPDRLAEKLDYLHTKVKEGVRWVLYRCDTCYDQHGDEAPYHVEILSKED